MILRLGIALSLWKRKWPLLTEESRYWAAAWSLAQTIREFQPKKEEVLPAGVEANFYSTGPVRTDVAVKEYAT